MRVCRRFAAPPSSLYRAWLEPELMREWLAPPGHEVVHVEVDERVGGRHRVWQDGGGFESEILELVPDHRIVLRCGMIGPDGLEGPIHESLLTVDLRATPDGGTELVLVHERLDVLRRALPEVADMVGVGWSITLARLDDVNLEGAEHVAS